MGAPLAFGSMIFSLANIAKNAGAMYKNASEHNWTFATIASGADTVADLAPFYARYKLAEAAGEFVPTTFVLEIALQLVLLVEQLNGIGNPDTGGAFNDGRSKINQIAQNLDQAVPNEGFMGTAGSAYGTQNEDLKQALKLIAEADQTIAEVLKEQAFLVDMARNGLAGGRIILAAALVWLVNYIIVNASWIFSPPGVRFVKNVQYGIAIPVLGGVVACVEEQIRHGFLYADKVQSATDKYNEAKAKAPKPKTTLTAPPAYGASGSTVSSFSEISDSMSGPSGLAGAPTASRSAGAVRYPGDRPAEDSDKPEHLDPGDMNFESVASEATPSPATSTPASTVPAFGRPAQMSGQGADVSGVPSKRQGQAAAPTEKGVPAEEAEDVEAGAGAGAGERAPVTAAPIGDTRAQEPSPVQRNL